MALQTTDDIGYDKEAWEMATHFALRPQLFYDSWATVKPGKQSTKGSVVTFTMTDFLEPSTTPLDEETDVTPETFGDDNISVTLQEYGNAVKRTRFLKEVSFIPFDEVVATVIGENAGMSLDTLARTALHGGTNVTYLGEATTRDTITPEDVISSSAIRRAVAKLRNRNVPTWAGNSYAASINHDAVVDLREETGTAVWSTPNEYGSDQVRIWNGEIGLYEGVRFVATPRAPILANAGAGEEDSEAAVYQTLILGRQFVAKAFAPGVGPLPEIVPGPVTDTLRRFVPMGWYWLGGYGIFREECAQRLEHGSSLDEGYEAAGG